MDYQAQNNMNFVQHDHGTINGIHCDVTNCVFNEPGSRCSAGHIQVGPTSAVSKSETVCATFQLQK